MLNAIDDARSKLFVQLAGGEDGELAARYLKGDFEAPKTLGRLIDDRVLILLTDTQLRDAEERFRHADGTRPNLTEAFQRWFVDKPSSFRTKQDSEGRGSWLSATTAANVYRWLYSGRDYPSAGHDETRKQATAIRGWEEWAFGQDDAAQDYLLLVGSADLPAVQAWLANPSGPPPLRVGPSIEGPNAHDLSFDFKLLPGEKARLIQQIAESDLPSVDVVHGWISAFQERFSLARLARLQGRELLEDMHGRSSGDCLMYWLEFKRDEIFDTSFFGGIRGGSSLKFVIYQSAEDGRWRTGTPNNIVEISEEEAIQIAENQRDQLLAASEVLNTLPHEPSTRAFGTLQADIEAAAPDFHHLAFFHKALYMCANDKLDDYHSSRVQDHMLACMSVEPPAPEQQKLYAGARYFVEAMRELQAALGEAVPMGYLTSALNGVHGQPVKHWRIGTGASGEHWREMRDREVAAIGWEALGDLSDIVSGFRGREGVEALKAAVEAQWPDKRKNVVSREARQIWTFYNTIQEGDRVYAAFGQTILGVGDVLGPYRYEKDDFPFAFRRRVRWLGTDPFRTPSRTGLQTTVYNLTRAFDIIIQAVRHMDQQVAAESPKKKPRRIAKALAPVAAQLERKGQVILYGPPGTGKTYHALQVAEELVARGSHGHGWADLSAEQRSALKGTGGPDAQRIWTCTFHPAYSYEDFVEGLKARPVQGGIEFRPEPGLFKRLCALAEQHRSESFVLIIDEFNRGDSPRIFGELLTLLELDKRERVYVHLPLSGERFTVPRNVRMLATMNTADRSISLLDAALRRRFGFVEYLPDADVLGDAAVQGLRLGGLLHVVNERLMETLGDAARNLQVGHAYFMSEAQPIASVVSLRNAVRYDLLPLLQDYCAEDPGALHSLLGDAFYDRERQRFRDELMETGRETDFIDALVNWNRDRLATEDEPDADEADLDDEDDEGEDG